MEKIPKQICKIYSPLNYNDNIIVILIFVQITFDNVKLNGQIKQDLRTWIDSFQCAGFIENKCKYKIEN